MANRLYLVLLLMAVAGSAAPIGDSRLADAGLTKRNVFRQSIAFQQEIGVLAPLPEGTSAVHRATQMIASLLLQADPSVGSANPEVESPLTTAARTGKVDAIKELLDHGADVNAKEDVLGKTALMWAVEENHLDAAKLLLERGADINAYTSASDPDGAMTALLFAAREGYQEMAALLLDRGADIKWSSANRTSPLLTAILNGHIELATQLLERGADANAADAYGRGPLFAAVELSDSTALIHALVEHGADVNARAVNFDGETSFLRAALSGDVSLMHYLLDHGADPNIGTLRGTSPLMAAAGIDYVAGQTDLHPESDYLEAITLCLEKGADINAANSEGITAMHGAASRGWESVIQLLANRGAKLDVKDNQGRTPMTFAESKPKALALLKSLLVK